jgi:hypothetical protein
LEGDEGVADAERRIAGDGREAFPRPRGAGPHEPSRRWSGDGDPLAQGMADVLVHRLFAVGLDLHAALTYIEAHIAEGTAVQKIHDAIAGLDAAIRDFRGVVFGLHQDGIPPATSASLRALIVAAVERACEPAGCTCPAITLGSGVDSLVDDATSQQVARLVHRVLALVPADRLPSAHVEVTVDPRPPGRLVVHIDAPVRGVADVAACVSTMGGKQIEVTCRALAVSPAGSHIRVECRAPVTCR